VGDAIDDHVSIVDRKDGAPIALAHAIRPGRARQSNDVRMAFAGRR
jgi:hypothetical protein